MAGYAAMARIGAIAPRFLPAPPAPEGDDLPAAAVDVGAAAVVEVHGEPRRTGRIGALLAAIEDLAEDVHEIWIQSRRVLADPGWR